MMAQKLMKKSLALLLTLVMVLGVTQMTAFAGNLSEEEEVEILVEIPLIPQRPVIPENPVRPVLPDVPVIIVGEDKDAPVADEEEHEAYDRPQRPRYQPQQEADLPPVEELPEEALPLTDLPVEAPVEEPVAEPVEEPVETVFEEEVPLADVPATGDRTALYTAWTLLSGTGLVWLGRKKQH